MNTSAIPNLLKAYDWSSPPSTSKVLCENLLIGSKSSDHYNFTPI